VNLERANERARSVPGPKNAARLYNDIEYELALGEPDDHLETIGEQSLVTLEKRFPGVRAAAREIEEPPSLSRRAKPRWSSSPYRDSDHGPVHAVTPPRLAPVASACAYGLAHPMSAVAAIVLSVVLIVHFLTYAALGALTVVALKAYGRR